MSLSGRWTNEIRGREEGDQSRGRSRRRSRRSSDGTRQNDGIIQMEFTKRGSCFELDQNWGSGSYGRYFLCVVRLFFSFLASSRFHHLFSSNNTVHRGFLIGEGFEILLFILSSLSIDRFLSFLEIIFEYHVYFLNREFKLATLQSIQTDPVYSIGFRLLDGKHFFFIPARSFLPFRKRRKAKDRFASKYNRPFNAACLFQFF